MSTQTASHQVVLCIACGARALILCLHCQAPLCDTCYDVGEGHCVPCRQTGEALTILHRYWRQVPATDRLRFLVEMLTPTERRALTLGFDDEETTDGHL